MYVLNYNGKSWAKRPPPPLPPECALFGNLAGYM